MRIRKAVIYLLVMTLIVASLPVNMLTGAAYEVSVVSEADEMQDVEVIEGEEQHADEEGAVSDLQEEAELYDDTEYRSENADVWMDYPEGETAVGDVLYEEEKYADEEHFTEVYMEEEYAEIVIEEVEEVEEYSASAIANGSCGENVTWKVESDGTLRISGTGPMDDIDEYTNSSDVNPYMPWYDYSSSITKIVIEEGVTTIGNNCFTKLTAVTEVLLPSTLKSIGRYAFWGCTFSRIDLPDGLKELKNGAFADTDLIAVSVPDSVEVLESAVFYMCYKMTWAKMSDSVTELPHMTFAYSPLLETVILPNGLTSISTNCFQYDYALKEIIIPAGVETLGYGAFDQCTALKNVYFLGDFPTLISQGSRAPFYKVEANLYYPADAAGWTEDAIASLGGTLTVKTLAGGCCGTDAKWSLGAGGVLTISGSGAMADYDQYSSTPWYVYADYINEIVIENGITEIGDSCFTTLTHLKKVSFPSTLERIGQQAFWGCENLDGVVLPNTVKILDEQAFAYCDSLTSLVIPDGVAGEGGYLGGCLDCCISLSSVELPENLTIIPGWLLYGCSSLENINIPESVTVIGEYAFSDCTSLEAMVIPLGVTEIGEGAFLNCTNLKRVSDMGKVTEIGKRAFYACEALESITFPEGISCLNAYVLGRCSSLKEFTIPESVSCIGEGAFSTSGLQKITIPKAVTEIKAAAFWQCGDLKEITFKGNLPAFTSARTEAFVESDTVYPFQGLNIDCYYPIGASGWSQTQPADCGGTLTMLPYGVVSGNLERDGEVYAQWRLRVDDGAFVLSGAGDMEDFGTGENDFGEDRPWHDYKDLIKKVTIGGGITSIGNYAFYECENLKEVSLSDGLNFIGESAFELSGLTSVRLPDSVKEIDKYSFMTCENLQIADLGEGLETIGACAFAECGSLSSIIIPASVKTIGASAFHCSGLAQVLFKGDLPAVGNNAFSTMPSWEDGIKVEYPDDNETWSDLTQSSLGGSSEGGVFEFGEHTHDWGNGVQTSTPTCTDSGEKIYTCGICGRTKTETVSATGHSAGSWGITKAATCTESGTKEQKCTKCYTVISAETIDAKGHSWSSWEVVASATVFDPQKEKRTCQTCKSTEEKTTGEKLQPTAELNYTNIPLQVGQSTTKIKVTGLAAGDSIKSWKSSKKSVAAVNSKGKITGKKVGTATITVTLASGLTKKITVKVQKKAVKTTAIWIVGYSDFTLQKGKRFDLAASMKPYVTPVTSLEKITYSSSDEKILKVNSKGVVTAVGAGKAKIIIKSGKIKDYATFTVPKVKTTGISNVPEKISLKKLKKYTIKAKLNPTDSDEKITYKSSNKKVATVNDKGVIRTWLKGTAKITVKSGSVKKVIKVTVK